MLLKWRWRPLLAWEQLIERGYDNDATFKIILRPSNINYNAVLHQAEDPVRPTPLLHLEDLGLVIPHHGLPPGLRIVHPGGPSVVLLPDWARQQERAMQGLVENCQPPENMTQAVRIKLHQHQELLRPSSPKKPEFHRGHWLSLWHCLSLLEYLFVSVWINIRNGVTGSLGDPATIWEKISRKKMYEKHNSNKASFRAFGGLKSHSCPYRHFWAVSTVSRKVRQW